MTAALHAALEPRLAGLGLTPRQLLERDAPGGLAQPGLTSANRHCHLLRCADGWLALNLAREDDRDLIPALCEGGADLAAYASSQNAAALLGRAIELQLPAALPGESAALPLAPLEMARVPELVVDLSALWAGPLCAALLARAGARVVRIESLGRPDPTAQGSPRLDALLSGGNERLPLDLRTDPGRAALHDLLARADVLVTSARPAALARLGLDPAHFPHLTWAAITAHGFTGPGALRVGFGDDCAVAGGLLHWQNGQPRFMGDALADPLTGLEAARAVLAGQRGLIDLAMARIAASYAKILKLKSG